MALAGISPDDVQVEAVYGSVDQEDRLTDLSVVALQPLDATDGTIRYEGEIPLNRTGGFGYTVRVLPKNDLLVNPAELGLVSIA